jgi:hypothetical protein
LERARKVDPNSSQEQLLAQFVEYNARLQQARHELEKQWQLRRELMEGDLLNDTAAFQRLMETDAKCKLWPEWCLTLHCDLSICETLLKPTLVAKVHQFRLRAAQAFQVERERLAQGLVATTGDMQIARALAAQIESAARWQRLSNAATENMSLAAMLALETKFSEQLDSLLVTSAPEPQEPTGPQGTHATADPVAK